MTIVADNVSLGATSRRGRFYGLWLAATALSLTALVPGTAMASGVERAIHVPAQPLSKTLAQIGRQSNVEIIFSEDDVRGRVAPALNGDYSVEGALSAALGNAPLTVRRTANGAYVVVATQRPVDAVSSPAADTSAGDIVVTAQLKQQRVIDVPISLSVVSGVDLQKNSITNLQDLSARMPNIRISTAPAASVLNIRGLGSGLNPGFEQSVGTFVDGLYRGRSRSIGAALFDVERVEILKGPQSTYFGNNVIAGALNITTIKPGDKFTYNASGLYAFSDGEYSVDGGVTLPLQDNLSVRIAARANGMDGYSTNTLLNTKEPHANDWIGRVSVAWRPTDNWHVDMRVDHGSNRVQGALPSELLNCPTSAPYPPPRGACAAYIHAVGINNVDDKLNYVSAKAASYNNYDFTEAGLTNRVDLGDLRFTATTGYFTHNADAVTVINTVPVPGIGGAASGLLVHSYESYDQYDQQVRLESKYSGPLNFMIGAYYSHEDLNSTGYFGEYFRPFAAGIGPYTANTPVIAYNPFIQTTDTYSAFGSLALRISEQLMLNLGARYVIGSKDVTVRDAIVGIGTVPGAGTFSAAPSVYQTALLTSIGGAGGNYPNPKRTDKKFLPSANIQYKITPTVEGYFSFAQGFKSGGFSDALTLAEFSPENVNAYEVGLKANLLDRHLFVSFAVFRSDYKNLQEATQNFLGNTVVSSVGNVPGARSQGVEFGTNLHVNKNLSFNADVAYLDAKYTSYPNAPCTTLGNALNAPPPAPACIQDMSGKPRPFAPEYSGNFGMSVTLPIDDKVDVWIDPSVYFSSSYFQSATADPLFSQAPFAKIDLRVAFGPEDKSWELAVVGKNLTDKITTSFSNSVAGSPGTYWSVPDRPRSVAIQFSIRG